MKRVVSVSIGSSKRDHYVETEIMGEKFIIERMGTDGSIKKAIDLIEKIDGKVDAIGMGGIDLYVWAGKQPYIIKEALPLKRAAKITPIVDGSGLKNTLEKKVIYYLQEKEYIDFKEKKVLITSGMDRYGMAESLEYCGANLILGDLIFALGINLPIYSLKNLHKIAAVVAPIACRLPFHMLYPTGDKQNKSISTKFTTYFDSAKIIAGDFHYIKRFMPISMKNKVIITNTITREDMEILKNKGVELLITTTPEFSGRSFGTNVMEGVIVSILKAQGKECILTEYDGVLNELDLKPRIEYLNRSQGAI